MTLAALALLAPATAAEKSAFTKKDKAFYLSEQEQVFVRPGLVFEIQEAQIDNEGVVKYRFTITDPAGLPLDREGVITPGPVSVSSVIATIPADQDQYVAYTTRIQEEEGRSEVQATSDSGGTFEQIAIGEYSYTFATRAPSGFDRTATHTVAAWASRDLSDLDLGRDLANDTFNFVPDGATVTKIREIVVDEGCNSCHSNLVFHGSRTGVALCITCHTPQTTDPGSGNTADFKVMVHKIHAGEHLPSVQAGNPYFFIGFRGSVADFSDVVYPADLRACQTCHTTDGERPSPTAAAEAEQGAAVAALSHRSREAHAGLAALTDAGGGVEQAQPNKWLTNPGRAQCGSCHDDVNFATGENHGNGIVQLDDSQCSRCHIPEGELEFDISIKGAHTIPIYSRQLAGTNFEIIDVVDTGPGQKPTVTFSIKQDDGTPILPADVSRLTLYLAGDTVDYREWWGESAAAAQGSDGVYFYTFERGIPENASGSWSVSIEGQVSRTLNAGTVNEFDINDAGRNVVRFFAVTDGEPRARRSVVKQEQCANCHIDFSFHGGPRKEVDFCVVCHIPSQTDAGQRTEEQMPPESVHFKDMIHRIHAGRAQIRDYTIVGFGGSQNNFNNVRYPNSLANCSACHVDDSYLLPLPAGVLATTSPRDFQNPTPPQTASCVTCHTSEATSSHAESNTSGELGESCVVCHGSGRAFDVEKVHAQ